ncbi:hypothetical protein K1Y72_25680 [Actinomadura sp. PM05-2]|uniref:Uncharacterized protein n=1 Tax=Actinomadura parmotrematis TaxID=2864039 RepID=A0ABS7FZC4_9ACTN|nr:hypothetical protein [Actinomadura parmotrematis]
MLAVFWRKQRAAIEGFHPLHQALVHQQGFSVSLPPADWRALVASLAQHQAHVKRRKWRLPERVPLVLVPLIQVLTEDMRGKATLSIAADLRGPDAPGKAGPQQRLPARRPVRSVAQWYAVDPWLRIRAELRDGSVLDVEVVDRVRYRKIHKVNSRGKHKWKTKTKTVRRIAVTRRIAKGAAVARPSAPPPRWIRTRVKSGERTVVQATAKVLANYPEAQLPQQILQVSTETFRWTRRTA